jgi:hypothetical protein
MLTKEIKKQIKQADIKERSEAFYTLYGVDSQKELLEQFESKVTALKVEPITNKRLSAKSKREREEKNLSEQYTKLLELILNYSHAIFFLYSKSQINKNLIAYQRVALKNIDESNVKKAFGLVKRLRDYKAPKEEPKEDKKEPLVVNSDCLAVEHINTLKSDLESDNINVRVDQKEDKKAYMKFAIISLATGTTASEITDSSYNIDLEKTSIFDSAYIGQLIEEIREYQETRQKPLSERGIRNGVDKLQLPLSANLKKELEEKASKAKKELPTHCRNFNHLAFLYNECRTK